jgi:hypothetical protein
MVGRTVRPDYRRCLNFLSRGDYTRLGESYMQILVVAIVVFATGPYHARVVRRNKFPSRKRVLQHEYRRDGSGRR